MNTLRIISLIMSIISLSISSYIIIGTLIEHFDFHPIRDYIKRKKREEFRKQQDEVIKWIYENYGPEKKEEQNNEKMAESKQQEDMVQTFRRVY